MPPSDGYLLDTNIASAVWDAQSPIHESVRSRLASSAALIYVSSVSIGEGEYGLGVSPAIDAERHRLYRAAMDEYVILPIEKHTAQTFGRIRAGLFQRYATRGRRGRLKEKYVEDLVDSTTGKELGIQENDLWIASTAVEYNLILATFDKAGGMRRIVDVASYTERTEFWT
ncbi:MAG: PIN domain-containing protein [Chloroflexi bacterium]|nr:PIN domain-containing protein [Chloroflexota bacterium]